VSPRERRRRAVSTTDRGVLPLTSYATLGLLSLGGEFTAVEIEERAYHYLRFFYWTPALSHIRRELDRLEDLGYVSCREVMRGRIRRTLKYWLTPAGVTALKEWAEGPLIERTVKKNPAILRLWLGRRGGDSSAVLRALEAHIEFERAERQSLIDHLQNSYTLYQEHVLEADTGSPETDEDLRAGLWRHAWHIEVMRYCLRDYDYELRNLEQLLSDMRQLATEQDSQVENSSVLRRRIGRGSNTPAQAGERPMVLDGELPQN
jgi:DNA-binding PadR family transcriptional regulator